MYVYLGLGSNLGDRVAHLRLAITRLGEYGRVLSTSPVYASAPMYVTEQPTFYNMAILYDIEKEPEEVLSIGKQIEVEAGRDLSPEAQRNGPRPLDIDILLLYAEQPLTPETHPILRDGPTLTVPHPKMAERAFVLQPLADLDPDQFLVEPRTGISILALLATVKAQHIERLGALDML